MRKSPMRAASCSSIPPYRYLKAGITRYTMNGENGIDYNVEMYNDMRVITVPAGRFNTVSHSGPAHRP